jgi:acetyltransferase-like isoleucine patch superfamily enzyme
MKRYGLIRPIAMVGIAFAKAGGRILRSAYQQRRLQTGTGVKVGHDVSFFGGGEVLLGDHVTIESGVQLRAEEGAIIEIGAGSYIGVHSSLQVRRGHLIRLGQNSRLGARCHLVSERGILLGDESSLGSESFVGPREDGGQGSLVVGAKSHLHSYTWIDLCADVTVGDCVRTGPYCAFYTHNHIPTPGKLVWDQVPSFAPIRIGSGTWIGHGCYILPGVSIGDHSTIATGAVVTRSLEPWTTAGGVPARVLKKLLA